MNLIQKQFNTVASTVCKTQKQGQAEHSSVFLNMELSIIWELASLATVGMNPGDICSTEAVQFQHTFMLMKHDFVKPHF